MRRRQYTVDRVAYLFHLFGIDMMSRWRLCQNGQEQVEAFEAARAEAKIHHRRLAMELHPDRGGDAEKLKEVNAAWSQLQKINMKVSEVPERKSALRVSETQGSGHTSVFMGVWPWYGSNVTIVTTGAGASITPEKFREMMAEVLRDKIDQDIWDLMNKPTGG